MTLRITTIVGSHMTCWCIASSMVNGPVPGQLGSDLGGNQCVGWGREGGGGQWYKAGPYYWFHPGLGGWGWGGRYDSNIFPVLV